MSGPGELVLVATPIGNLADLSPRACEVLAAAGVILCEDTRHSGRLLARAGVRGPRLVSLHAHNEAARLQQVLSLLEAGEKVAVVSDAGMPAISDPGGRLVDAAHRAGARLSVVPGPSAAPAAVALAGFSSPRWCFEGFLPAKEKERSERLRAVASSPVPTVIYESPRRVDRLVSQLGALCRAERLLLVCRELTKLHEEIWRGPLFQAASRWPEESTRGEFVLVLDGEEQTGARAASEEALAALVAGLIEGGLSRRDAVDEAAGRSGLSRREVYEALSKQEKASSDPL